MASLVNVVVIMGMLVIVPAGLALIGEPALRPLRTWWPLGAIPGGIALWLPRGLPAALLATPYVLFTLALALRAPRRVHGAADVAVMTALATPAVAGVAMVAERWGYRLFGFRLETLRLTEAHFHFAGFAAALIAGLVCRADGTRRAARAAALAVPAGTAIVLAGFFAGDWIQLAGAAVLTAGMWLVGWLTWRDMRDTDRLTRTLLVISAGVLAVTMLLALDWALGEASGLPHLPIAWMAASHGAGNAFGFALCGILAWRRLQERTA